MLIEGQPSRARFWQILAFSGNDTATNASLVLVSTFFVVMLTDNLLLSGLVAGLILTFARLFDGVTDPLIGMWLDNTVTRWGKFRPFLLGGSIMINIGMLFIFGGFVRFSNPTLQYAWIIVWYAVYIIGYTAQSACTKSAQVQLTSDTRQRSLLAFLTSIIDAFYWNGFLAVSVNYVAGFPGGLTNPTGYRHIVLLAIAVNILLTFFALLSLREHDRPEFYSRQRRPADRVRVGTLIDLISRNHALQALIAAAATNKLAWVLQGAAAVYFYVYTVQNLKTQATVSLLALPAMFVGNFVGMWIARRTDRKTSFLAGTWAAILLGGLVIIVRPFDVERLWLFLLLISLVNAANGITAMNIIPMIADVADYDHWKNGRFVPGLVGTTFGLVDKLVSSASGLLIGGLLTAIGYQTGMEWSPVIYWAFLLVMLGVPVAGHLISVIAMRWYPINGLLYAKIQNDLDPQRVLR